MKYSRVALAFRVIAVAAAVLISSFMTMATAPSAWAGQVEVSPEFRREPTKVQYRNLGEGLGCREIDQYTLTRFQEYLLNDVVALSDLISTLKSGSKYDRLVCSKWGRIREGHSSQRLIRSCPIGVSPESALQLFKLAIEVDEQISNLRLNEVCGISEAVIDAGRDRDMRKIGTVLQRVLDRQIEVYRALDIPSVFVVHPGYRDQYENPKSYLER